MQAPNRYIYCTRPVMRSYYYLIIFFVILAFFTCMKSVGYNAETEKGYRRQVQSPVEQRKIPDDQWNKWINDPAFQYQYPKEKTGNTAVNNWLSFLEYIYQFFSTTKGQLLIWIAVASMVLFFLFKILQAQGKIFFSKKDKKLKKHITAQNQELTNWDSAIEEALQQKDYRLAVRYTYMQMLEWLNENAMIRYHENKTNYVYVQELRETAIYKPFLSVTIQYEYIWYGAFEIEKAQFDQYYQQAGHIKSVIS